MQRLLINLCSDRLTESREFYVALLNLTVQYDSDWYIQLVSPNQANLVLGIIRRDHDLVPEPYQTAPTGMYLTFVVADVDAVYETACSMGLEILQPPRNEFYGQRRFLTVDPNGCLLDISSPA
ncbi:VOC family protein [Vacuolonema iberomarrocanum]|uniref:VOC family protein n=1 Tax=Vacuolonema iberomarrocanum TaxID=3454632 RepID=UPI0019F0BA53|nr:VOC family protein [filamentous cyanobacterium LEGE 07170]